MTRIEAITRLTEITDQLNADELRVLAKFGRKILKGSVKHGHMDLINDTRDWTLEQQDERVDDACYGYMREVQAEMRAERRATTDPVSVGLREIHDTSPATCGRLYGCSGGYHDEECELGIVLRGHELRRRGLL